MTEQINAALTGVLVPILLCLSGVFYTVCLGGFHILKPWRVIRGMLSGGGGGVSSAKAVTLALAGTLGVGNIVGVASAIHLGGFGAVLWIWVSALLAMILKYAEIVLAMRHRRLDSEGNTVGGAMYYILDFFTSAGMKKIGRAVSSVFALAFILCALFMGGMLQSGAVADALYGVVGTPRALCGAVLAVLTLTVSMRGASGIVKVTNFLVPFMSVGYAVLCICVIVKDASRLPEAFGDIFSSALHPSAAAGGVGGFAFMRAVRYGVMRGLVSNEAGCGTAPTAHAIADAKSPSAQGMWGIFEVFADTVVLCTLTALVIILEYDAARVFEGNYMMMSIAAFSSVLGRSAEYFLALSVTLFGFATIVCWTHYGRTAAYFICPRKSAKNLFCFVYAACIFLGAVVRSDTAWLFSDMSMGIMTVINLCILLLMSREIIQESKI